MIINFTAKKVNAMSKQFATFDIRKQKTNAFPKISYDIHKLGLDL